MVSNTKASGNAPSVLITGGSGLVGRYLTSLLLENGFTVSHLSRSRISPGVVKVHLWSPEKGVLDPAILAGTDYIIHLAGASIGEGRWSSRRKREIIESRVGSATLLFNTVKVNRIPLKAFISSSATGYYGSLTTDHVYTEDDPSASDFLGTTCRLWEEAAGEFSSIGIRNVMIRSGVVLARNEGALSKMLLPARFGIFALPGTGRQSFPWIHITDLCRIYLMALLRNEMSGAWNAVSPSGDDFRSFNLALANILRKRYLPVTVPPFLVRLAMGEASTVVLHGSRISSSKIEGQGFRFLFSDPETALADILG